MWTHCTFCTRDLGRNEALEVFPIGTRLTFDPARGRLWVVCRSCGGWNLTPLEERWEAVEDCERLFRQTRTRVSTEQLGLARLSSGLELIRVGEPLRPEFAAWRNGDELGRRRRRTALRGVAGGVGVAGVGTGALLGGLGGLMAAQVGVFSVMAYGAWAQHRTVTRIRGEGNRILGVRGMQLGHSFLMRVPDEEEGAPGFCISVPYRGGREVLTGEAGRMATSRVIRRINWLGGSDRQVEEAVERIEQQRGTPEFLDGIVQDHAVPPGPPEFSWITWRCLIESRGKAWRSMGKTVKGALTDLAPSSRLAFEMALQEETERRAMEGELRILERAWEDAEEIAAIADGLIPPSG